MPVTKITILEDGTVQPTDALILDQKKSNSEHFQYLCSKCAGQAGAKAGVVTVLDHDCDERTFWVD